MNRSLEDLWWGIRWSSRATALLHVFAMWAPFNSWRLWFYRRRGVRIGRNVYIVQGTFLEESRPWLIEIHDWVRIGARCTIVTHDAVYHGYDNSIPHKYGRVVLKRRATVCPGAVIMPGVTVGEDSVVAPGAIVLSDVPSGVIVAGAPAMPIMTLESGLERSRLRADRYRETDEATKYPWKQRASDLR